MLNQIPHNDNTLIYIRKSSLLLAMTLFLSLGVNAEIRPYQTTRMKSTAGAGVGSYLIDESIFLNPAPMAFFTIGSLYLHRNTGDENFENNVLNDRSHKDTAIIASDSTGFAGGAIAYVNQKRGQEQRKVLGASMAYPFSPTSSMGVSFQRFSNKEFDNTDSGNIQSDRSNLFTFGVTHLLTDGFSLGITVRDPFKATNNLTLATVGAQYSLHDYIILILDIGTNYTDDFNDNFVYRGALQVMFFDDFFIRFGIFDDNSRDETGTGVGLSWVGPKLSFDFAIQQIKRQFTLTAPQKEESKIKETSISLSYRF